MFFFFFQAEDGIRDKLVTGVQTCALPIYWVRLTPGASPGISGGPGSEPLAEPQPERPVPERFGSGAGRRGGAGGVRNRADERHLVIRAPAAGDHQPEVPCRLVGGATEHLL